MSIKSRYMEIVSNMNEYTYHILGCGAIGSSTAIQLVRTGADNFVLYDMDKVELENVGVSQYILSDIDKLKVDSLAKHIKSINEDAEIDSINGLFERLNITGSKNIVILGFDSMKSRLTAMKSICKYKPKPELVIDGRMGAEQFQQYMFDKPTLNKYIKTWYSDKDGDPEPCSAKATSYCSNMSGSFIVNSIRKYITNQPYDLKLYFNFPVMMLGKNT